MAVVSSLATLEGAQKDGSKWCREVHSISDGSNVQFYYLVPAGTTQAAVNATATARAAQVASDLADSEAQANVDRDDVPTLVHQTAAQFAARLRAKFLNGGQAVACQLAWWLLRRIAAGQITDAQCRTAFGLTAAQWTTVKTNQLQPRSDAWTAVLAAGGV
jgi:hypothetical protein